MRSRSSRLFYAAMALFLSFAVTLAGCGKATRDSADSRFRSARDKVSALSAKDPSKKIAIDDQLRTLDKDFEIAKAKTNDEEAIKAMNDVASRAEKFEADVVKTLVPGGAPAGTATGMPPAPAPGGKLGGGAPPPAPGAPVPGMAGGNMPGGGMPGGGLPGGGLPGGAAPAPGGKLGGGAVPPPAPAPAPAPAPGGGFGGQ